MSAIALDYDQIFSELKDLDVMLQDARAALLAPGAFPAFNLIPAAQLGIEVLGSDPSNNLLVEAKFPEGWDKRAVDSVPMTAPFVGIYDERSRERARIFFNCDDPARITYRVVVLCRYGYRLENEGIAPIKAIVILDTDREIDRIDVKPMTIQKVDQQAQDIMDSRFRNWRDPRAYW